MTVFAIFPRLEAPSQTFKALSKASEALGTVEGRSETFNYWMDDPIVKVTTRNS